MTTESHTRIVYERFKLSENGKWIVASGRKAFVPLSEILRITIGDEVAGRFTVRLWYMSLEICEHATSRSIVYAESDTMTEAEALALVEKITSPFGFKTEIVEQPKTPPSTEATTNNAGSCVTQ